MRVAASRFLVSTDGVRANSSHGAYQEIHLIIAIVAFCFLYSSQALAKFDSAICETSLTNGLFATEYDEMAMALIKNCRWQNCVSATGPHLAMLLGYRKTPAKIVAKVWSAKVGNVMDLIPEIPGVQNLERLSKSEITFNFPYVDESRKIIQMPRLSVTTDLTREDFELVALSQRESLPYEAGHFRYHFADHDQDYETGKTKADERFVAHRFPISTMAKHISDKIKSYARRGKRVTEVEYVHTHPYDSMLFYDKEGSIVIR